MKKVLLIVLFPLQLLAQNFSAADITKWEKQAAAVTIYRDNYGIPHIYGKTDADAVFGLLYAQCEDDFKRVEMNYIEKLGARSMLGAEGAWNESVLYEDLLIKTIIDTAEAKKDFEKAPQWLKKLCIAFADGINYYLYKHPDVHPALLNQFQPWYPLLWTDGSIGAINTAGLTATDLKNLYSSGNAVAANADVHHTGPGAAPVSEESPTGSNGFAFSSKITESGNAILYINPHVTFYFRPEVHIASEEGLNVYGAVTWGQFFVYQGFNEHCGWMHTSSAVDAADVYIEKITKKGNKWFYEYEGRQKEVTEKKIELQYTGTGNAVFTKNITVLYTHHGPVMTYKNGTYLSLKADNRIMNGLVQCWLRNKATGLTDFKKTLDLKGNISNNTVYADAQGNIAYWHGNRIPVRNPKYDWSKPVDGSIAATEWKGYHPISKIVQRINPPNGWLQNCNSTPYTVAGNNSPKKENYPAYMAPDGENFRGINAVRTLSEENKYTVDKVIQAGYDTRLAAFEVLIPALIKTFDTKGNPNDLTHSSLKEPVNELRNWNYRCGENSIATTLAVTWGEKILPAINRTSVADDIDGDAVHKTKQFAANASFDDLVIPFQATINELVTKFGKWQTPWGEINRFQRLSSAITNIFDDNKSSIPVGFVSSTWGMLPSYTSLTYPGTKKRYGLNGNSFVCAVEFGKHIKAKSLLAGGESGNENSPHFFDQGLMYSKGRFKDVLFYKEDVLQHVERSYHPGE
jgi:acyl-homoserine-lactone acylase